MVERPRILQALDGGAGSELTLVAAPVGYGKTTAVHTWCDSRNPALAWVTLDDGDNDPGRLWRHVATAADRVRDGVGRRALQRLNVAGTRFREPVDELMNGAAAFGKELVIVLDDLNAVTDADCISSLQYAVDHLPSNTRMIVITRIDPGLKLSELRARGGLTELRAAELAFDAAEARKLLVEHARLELDAADVDLLRERTEGWPAALFLAALWLRGVADPQRAVREFGGDHRFIAEYLSQEVLGSLDDELRTFLLRASVLGQFTPQLCDDVLDQTASAALLARLERSNLFIVPLARGWFRIHSLFATFARFQLAAVEPQAAASIHRKAALWLRAHGLAEEAAAHAHEAGDHALLAEILLEYHLHLIRNGGERTLLRWVRTLPDEQLLEHPELTVVAAEASTMVGEGSVERRRFLQLTSRSEANGQVSAYSRAVAAMVRATSLDRSVRDAVDEGRRAVEMAREGADDVVVAALAALTQALYFAGDLGGAWAAGLEAIEHPAAERRTPGQSLARSSLALVAVERGNLASARLHLEAARSLLSRVGSTRNSLAALASAALGTVLYAEGNFAGAERELASAEKFFQDDVATVHQAWLLALLARARCARGRLGKADAALHACFERMAELTDAGMLTTLARAVEQELGEAKKRTSNGAVLEPPSRAELAVLRLLASDLSTREVAAELYLSPNTVRSHTRAIYRKFGVNSRSDAVARALAMGVLEQA